MNPLFFLVLRAADAIVKTTISRANDLEMKTEFGVIRPRCDKVRPAERGEEVIECRLVRQVDDREAQAPLEAVAPEQIVIAHAGVKQVARNNARRIVVLIKRRTRDVN